MTNFYIDALQVPAEVKKALHDLSKNIDFLKADTKAGIGFVFFGKNKITQTHVTVKFYYWGGQSEHHAEPQQLAQLNSENILSIQDAGLIDSKFAYFTTPTCTKGDIDEVLQQAPVGTRLSLDYAYQILSGLSHLHAKRFLHRDIKPSNIYLTDEDKVVIGDFGSVKQIPEGSSAIPASSHTLLFRPPETIMANTYGITGDIYQTGVVLFQLLGGALPYDSRAHLTKREAAQYDLMKLDSDREDFAVQCIRSKIVAGTLMNHTTLPPWVPAELKRLLNKACHVDPANRFQNASSFMAKIHEIRPRILDWQVIDGAPTLKATTSFRILNDAGVIKVQKCKGKGWRFDQSLSGIDSLPKIVNEISAKFST